MEGRGFTPNYSREAGTGIAGERGSAACSASTGTEFLNRILGWSTSDSTPETDTFIGERSTRSKPFPLARIHR